MQVAEKFLETFFPLLDCASEQRFLIEGVYADSAVLTVTYCYKLRECSSVAMVGSAICSWFAAEMRAGG